MNGAKDPASATGVAFAQQFRPLFIAVLCCVLPFALADGRAPIWLPLSLEDMPRFASLVNTYAGPDHPLSAPLSRWIRT